MNDKKRLVINVERLDVLLRDTKDLMSILTDDLMLSESYAKGSEEELVDALIKYRQLEKYQSLMSIILGNLDRVIMGFEVLQEGKNNYEIEVVADTESNNEI